MINIKKSRVLAGLLDRLVSWNWRRGASVFCGFIVFCPLWLVLGIVPESFGWITHGAWWMFYGVIVYKLCGRVADSIESFAYKKLS